MSVPTGCHWYLMSEKNSQSYIFMQIDSMGSGFLLSASLDVLFDRFHISFDRCQCVLVIAPTLA
jgi:hypothetical protein